MDDIELEKISSDIDDTMLELVMKHKISFLEFTAIVLARLTHASIELELQESFSKLLNVASETAMSENALDFVTGKLNENLH